MNHFQFIKIQRVYDRCVVGQNFMSKTFGICSLNKSISSLSENSDIKIKRVLKRLVAE